MALRRLDSCGDHYAGADIFAKWAGQTGVTLVAGGPSGNFLRLAASQNNTISMALTVDAVTVIFGFRLRMSVLPSTETTLLRLSSGASREDNIFVKISPAARIVIYYYNNGFFLITQSAPSVLLPNTWQYVEVKVLHALSATGTVDVRVGGVTVISETGKITADPGGAAYCSRLDWQGNNDGTTDIDDIYVCDATGALNNNFLGDIRVDVLKPNGVGRIQQWGVTGAATHHEATDETTLDGDTTYISESVLNDVDVVAMEDLPADVTSVLGVQACIAAKKADLGAREITTMIGDGVSEVASTNEKYLWMSAYGYLLTQYDQDPVSAAAWTPAKVNAAQLGVKITA